MRLIVAVLYLVLTAGAFTMVYPFVLMLSTSLTSGADVNKLSVVPGYLYSAASLFPKYVDDRYAGDVELVNQYYNTDFSKIDKVTPPTTGKLSASEQSRVKDWRIFVQGLPINYEQAAFEGYQGSPSKLAMAYQDYCRKRFSGNIHALNKSYTEENESFRTVIPPFERFKKREWEPDDSPKMREWIEFKKTLPGDYLRPILVDPAFQTFLKEGTYEGKIDKLNAAWATKYRNFTEIHLTATAPAHPGRSTDWEAYIRTQLPFRYMSVSPAAVEAYRAFLSGRYKGVIGDLNIRHQTHYAAFSDISLPAQLPKAGTTLIDWQDFIAKAVPINDISVENTENLYREHLRGSFASVADMNKAFGTRYASFDQANTPVYLADWTYCSANASALRWEFATRNYAVVIDFMLLHGRAVLNTFIFVVAVILVHLIVNPLCAYALSRYNLPYAYNVLLFLLATMAFPAEVAMIPNFLLLKQFHMLNTYWALILPGMASGYAIFLLKGFFDSLPKELYEAGIIDGASEGTMFRKITIPMSKPIFAVIALQAFTGAYGAFMYAMLVCQDSRMWTMMVWLYQLQATSPQYVTMAALTLAALPTLIVFIFAQNVIMRGIIIPSFK